jgi:hypothetical protein
MLCDYRVPFFWHMTANVYHSIKTARNHFHRIFLEKTNQNDYDKIFGRHSNDCANQITEGTEMQRS